jgi:hypothetical protein
MKEVQVFLNTQKIEKNFVYETHFKERKYVSIPNYITHATNHCDGTTHAG